MMRRLLILLVALPLITPPIRASDPARVDDDEIEQDNTAQEAETPGIIPEGGLTVSTQPVTPVALLPKRNPYDQGLEELALAQGLLKNGRVEAASDVSLQAYDDLKAAYAPRREKKKRKKLMADRHEAATVYVLSSLAYIEEYVKRAGGGSEAIKEGHARAADLRDVSVNYPELNKKVSGALERYTVATSSPTAR
jgi:hypothetical protein